MNLENKVAIVTGGSSGIGAAIVLEFARQGADVVIDYRSLPDSAQALEREVIALGHRAITVQADVGKLAELQRLIDAAVHEWGRVDILVNNAGIETRSSVLETTEEQYDRVLAVDLKSAFFGTQLAARQMIRQGHGGCVLNISSVHEDWPMPGNTPYCLAKGGLRMLTRTAGLELARHQIRVVGLGPGAVATPINREVLKTPELMQKLNQSIPLGRVAQPEEIARAAAYLAGDGASYITATTLFVDGGIMQQGPGL